MSGLEIVRVDLEGLKLIQLKVFGDARGFFVERFHRERFLENGLPGDFVQDNHSRSVPGVVRGLHYQVNPDQGKMVGVVRGRIWDVAVDLRKNSPTFGKYYATELSSENGRLLWVPGGFAHGFCVIGDEPADVLYKVTAPYDPKKEGGIYALDPDLNIPWPVEVPELSGRDKNQPSFQDYRANPVW